MPLSLRRLALLAAAIGALAHTAGAQDGPRLDAPEIGAAATQRLSLETGPNLVSLFVQPDAADLESLLGDGLANVLSVLEQNGPRRSFLPRHGIRTLDAWADGHGYVVHASQPVEIDVSGRILAPRSEIVLGEGWNTVAYLPNQALPVEQALASIAESVERVTDGDGRVYPAEDGAEALTVLRPGAGYRIHLSRADTLIYSTSRPPSGGVDDPGGDADFAVGSIEAALALEGLTVGQIVRVDDPVRGGRFVVTSSGAPTDGGTVFVPTEHTDETTATGLRDTKSLYDGPNDDGIVWESFKLYYGPGASDYITALELHGHGADVRVNGAEPFLSTSSSEISLPRTFTNWAGNQTGSDRLSASYRFATSPIRLERAVPAISLEGAETSRYVRPEWWGAVPYPDGWTPDPSPPPGPLARPTGIVMDDPTYDASDRIATAINVAEAHARSTGGEHYVVLRGMYGYSRVIEMQDRVVLKGEVDGLRSDPGDTVRQGMRVLKGAPWYRAATRQSTEDAYIVERAPKDWLLINADPMTLIRHGRRSMINRLVDLELDGNIEENAWTFDDDYLAGAGPGSGIWHSAWQVMLQNTPHWNAFSAYVETGTTIPGSNARFENVHAHDYGGNILLGAVSVHFGGSRDLKLGNSVKNHLLYRTYTGEMSMDRVELYGYSWASHAELQQGTFNGVTVRDLAYNPWYETTEVILGHRNDGLTADELENANPNGGYYYGDDVRVSDVRFEVHARFRPKQALIGYDAGPVQYRNVTVDVEGSTPVSLATGGSTDDIERSAFHIRDVTAVGEVRSFSAGAAKSVRVRSVESTAGAHTGVGVLLQPFREGHVATVYDVGVEAPLWAAEPIKIRPLVESEATTLDVYVRNASFAGVKRPVMTGGTTPSSRFRVYWRDVSFDHWTRTAVSLQHFDRVTARGRQSENAGSTTVTASGGETWVDIDPGLFYKPMDDAFVTVSGADAALYSGTWEAVGDQYDPTIRLALTRPLAAGETVTFDWTAAIRPIPDNVVFPD